MTDKPTLICDIETYRNFFLIGFKRTSDGVKRFFEKSDRATFDRDLVRRIMLQNRIVTFNGEGFDVPLIFYALAGKSIGEIKLMANRIIQGNVRKWDVEKLLEIRVPWEVDHIDLIEPQPNPIVNLKTLEGRLHGPKVQDLPYPHDAMLTHEQMDLTILYNGNDLDATELLLNALAEPLALRADMGARYGLNLMSKSDAQCGEQMIKKRVEQLTKRRIEKVETPAGTMFPFKIPDWLEVHHPELQTIVERLRVAEFTVKHDGKVAPPEWLKEHALTIGQMTYAMGIGGLHSTESARAVHSDDDHVLIDFDVASYYPAIILNSGLYPRSMGREFLEVFRQIRDERVVAKRRVREIGDKEIPDLRNRSADTEESKREIKKKYLALQEERDQCIAADKGLKIALNGCFGKLGSPYSVLYAPHLLMAITLGGQMALLMLIDRMERAGMQVVSGNTDGVVVRCPRDMAGPIAKSRLLSGELKDIIETWEEQTGFELEATEYRSLYSASVNAYYAFKPDGKPKVKGAGWTGRYDGDLRSQLMKNPQMEVCALAVIALITKGTPLEHTIRACTDIRDFVTIVNVKGGGTWRGEYLGKVVRYIWSTDGDEILYQTPHPTTGNYKKVSKTDGCRPVMELPDELPADLDYARYVEAAQRILMDIGYRSRPPELKAVRVLKRFRYDWLALSLAA